MLQIYSILNSDSSHSNSDSIQQPPLNLQPRLKTSQTYEDLSGDFDGVGRLGRLGSAGHDPVLILFFA